MNFNKTLGSWLSVIRIGRTLVCTSVIAGILILLAACEGVESTPIPTPTATPVEVEVFKTYDRPPTMGIDIEKKYVATMETNKGVVVIDLLPQEAPVTVNNFVFLAREGFYDGTVVHRIIKNFMIQAGDPEGTGRGGPGYRFQDELVVRDYVPGIVAMANAGPNTNGSQFFIMHGARDIPKNYTIFGVVASGLDVVDEIANTSVRATQNGELSVPTEQVTLDRITIEESD